jgi:hypothetical protein
LLPQCFPGGINAMKLSASSITKITLPEGKNDAIIFR